MKIEDFIIKFNKERQIYLLCKVFPGSSETKIKEIKAREINGQVTSVLYISIGAPADKNKANKDLIEFLAQEFDTKRGSVIIVSGKTGRLKLVRVIK